MLYKRPNFKMGGKPTGIETLEPRKKFQFGTPEFSFLEPGLQRELQIQNELRNKPTRFGQLLKRFPRILPIGTYGTAAAIGTGIGELADFITKATDTPEAYAFRKEATRANPFLFDETSTDEFIEFSKKLSELDQGKKPGLYRGGVDKFIEDQEKQKKERREAFDRPTMADIAGKVIPEKKAPPPNIIINDTKTDGETVEDSFEADFNRMQKRITKFLKDNKQETKGKVAIALSDAVGTPGTLADKAAVLNNALLGIASAKKKDEKDIAKLAFAAATELEGKRIDADKLTTREKTINRYTLLKNKR